MSLQHPEFDRFKQALAESRSDDALQHLDRLLIEHPASAALHWHRAQVLGRLGRAFESFEAVENVLQRRPDYLPAMQLRAQLEDELREAQPTAAAGAIAAPARSPPRPDERASGSFRARRNDPDDAVIERIVEQVRQALDEPAPGLTVADPNGFPEYQRRFHRQRLEDLSRLGLQLVADAEANGLRASLAQRVLIGCFSDVEGEVGVISFTVEPSTQRRANPISRWLRSADQAFELTECSTRYDDGAHLSTLCGNEPAYRYGPPLHIECLPARTSLTELIARHSGRVAEYRRQHPQANIITALDLAGFEQRWIASQQARKAYRQASGYLNDAELRALLGPDYVRYARRVRERLQEGRAQ